jgi:hypothetical protein
MCLSETFRTTCTRRFSVALSGADSHFSNISLAGELRRLAEHPTVEDMLADC